MNQNADDLEPIRLIIEGGDLSGWVRPGDQRWSDILQAGKPFAFLPAGADRNAWTQVDPDELVLVIPPPHVSAPTLRLPTVHHEVRIRAGNYRVMGTAHLRPGEQDDPILRATRRFLPLTNATFGFGDEPAETADVLIVNLRRVEEFNAAPPD